MTHEGRCLCGAVTYRIAAEPITARACWCRLCQYIGAGSATVNAFFPADAVTATGELGDYVCQADSGNTLHRRFCPACGTHMFSAAEERPHLIAVRAGTLDNPEIAAPAVIIWTSEAPDWACFNPEIPQDTHQPPPAGR